MKDLMYEGRRLARPDEDLVDQGLEFDLGTLMGRRQLLRAPVIGTTAVGLAACGSDTDERPSTAVASGSSSTASGEIPDETAGPYPGDGSNGPNVLTRSGIVRGDIRSSFGGATGRAEGVPMTLELTITDLANGGRAFAGVAVYAWHCDWEGRYSLYSQGITAENYLRGVQIADAAGKMRFTSIFPACYSGRWPHIHFEVHPDQAAIAAAGNAIATSQVAMPKDAADKVYATTGYSASVTNLARVTLQDDNVFGDDDGITQLGAVSGDVAAGYTVTLTAGVDTAAAPTGGRNAGDGAPSGAPGGPGGSGGPGGPGGSGGPGGPPPSGPRPGGAPS